MRCALWLAVRAFAGLTSVFACVVCLIWCLLCFAYVSCFVIRMYGGLCWLVCVCVSLGYC